MTLFFFLFQTVLYAQEGRSYAIDKPSQLLYLTTDKTVYVPGEVIWFATYFLDPENTAADLGPDMLTVALMREDTTAFSLSKNYSMQQGLCAGSLTLPDSLAAGDYTLIAAGDLLDENGKPYYTFKTKVRIKSPNPAALYASFDATAPQIEGEALVLVQLSSADRSALAGDKNKVSVHLSAGWKQEVPLDLLGKAKLHIPQSEIDRSDGLLYCKFQAKDKAMYSNYRLPTSSGGLEQQQSVQLSAFPASKAWIQTDAPLAKDTLHAQIFSPNDSLVLIHTRDSYGNTVAEAQLKVRTDKVNKVLVPLVSAAAGIHEILLLNTRQDTLSRQLFFARHGREQQATISSDKETYSTRDRVSISLDIKDDQGQPLNALLSLSCVYTGRLDKDQKNNLPAYFYLNKLQRTGMDFCNLSDSEALAGYLRDAINGRNIINARTKVTLHRPTLRGQVYLDRKSKDENSYTLLFKKDTVVSIGETDSRGQFTPDRTDLLVTENRKLFVFPNFKADNRALNPNDYWVSIPNPMETPLQRLAKDISAYHRGMPVKTTRIDTAHVLKGEPMNFIEEVAVFAKPNEVRKDYVRYGVNECGDYVCQHNYLNCGIHAVGRPAIKGQSYINFTTGLLERYKGCDVPVVSSRRPDEIHPIYKGKLFRGMSDVELADKNNMMYLTTLHWVPYLSGDADKHIGTSFFTSDMEGKYSIRVEGITANGKLFFAEKIIEVRK